jgi:hypothetical protein
MMVRNVSDGAAMNLRMATTQLAGIRIPPRVRTIPPMRRRLPVEVISEPAQVVNIRQAVPKPDTRITESVPIQNQRV